MKKPWVLHPFLFCLFSVLTLFAGNLSQYQLSHTFGALIKLFCGTLIALLVLWSIFKNSHKAGILIIIFYFFFLQYSHLDALFPEWNFSIGNYIISQRHVIVLFATVVWFLAAYLLFKTRSNLANVTVMLNIVTFLLVAPALFKITVYEVQANSTNHSIIGTKESVGPSNVRVNQRLPHIFYIILDGYGREDMLRDLYNYDNSPFLSFLESRGFYVAHQSRTNYSHTFLSLASSLNMEYLDRLSAKLPEDYTSQEPAADMISHSKIRDLLHQRGYSLASISSGYSITEIEDAEIFVNETNPYNEFELGYWNLTAFSRFLKKDKIDRDRIFKGLDSLPRLAQSSKPLFVFAHIVSPHPPFLFSRDGTPAKIKKYFGSASANHLIGENQLTRSEYMNYYIDQLDFLNTKMVQVVNSILSSAEIDPVIIIQGDHGPGSFLCHESLEQTYLKDRMSILNVYHIPGIDNKVLYSSITPVNSFRVLLNHLFGLDYPLLPDRNYFSQIRKPYRFRDVTDEIGGPEDFLRYQCLKSVL